MINLLISATESLEFENGRGMSTQKFERSATELTLYLEVDLGERQQWLIKCFSPKEFQITYDFIGGLELVTEHVLLWPFVMPKTELFFYSPAAVPLEVVGALYECHMKITGGWFPFNQFINAELDLSKLLAANSGKLASGPVSVLKEYQDVLRNFGIKASTTEPKLPRRWENGVWLENSTTRLELLILDKSYVIAENFTASKQ